MADIGKGAGAGAAIGTAITPGVGTVIGAGVGALGSLIGGVLSGKSADSNNAKSQERAQAYWKEQFDMQNARQDWLNDHAYTTQVKAMRNAGLNPALAMQGGQFSGNVASASGVGASSPSGGDFSGIGASAIQSLIGLQQMKNDTLVAQSQARANDAAAENAYASAAKYTKDVEWYDRKVLAEIGVDNATIDHLKSSEVKNLAEVYKMHQTLSTEIDEMKSRIDLNRSQEALNLIEKDYAANIFEMQLETAAVQNNLARANIKKIAAEIDNLAKIGANLEADTKNKAQEWLLIHNQAGIAGSQAHLLQKQAQSFIGNHPDAAHYIDSGINVLTSLGSAGIGVGGKIAAATILK